MKSNLNFIDQNYMTLKESNITMEGEETSKSNYKGNYSNDLVIKTVISFIENCDI